MGQDDEILEDELGEDGDQRALAASIEEELRELGPIVVAGFVPLGLVLLVLSPLLGDVMRYVIPVAFGAWIFGVPIAVAALRRNESALPFVVPGHGSFTGRRKRHLLAGGAVVATLAATAYTLAQLHSGQWLGMLRDWLGGWTI